MALDNEGGIDTMRWIVGTINKHLIQDEEGEYIATARTTEIAAQIVDDHNEVVLADEAANASFNGMMKKIGVINGGWTNRL